MDAIEDLKQQLDIPATIKETLSADEQTFYAKVEQMAEQAFDDQCTGANPRYPLIHDLRELYVLAYLGCRIDSLPFNQSAEIPALV